MTSDTGDNPTKDAKGGKTPDQGTDESPDPSDVTNYTPDTEVTTDESADSASTQDQDQDQDLVAGSNDEPVDSQMTDHPSTDIVGPTPQDNAPEQDDTPEDDTPEDDTPAADALDDENLSPADRAILGSTDKIWANREVLEISHVPDDSKIVCRDDHILNVASKLSPAAKGREPENLIIYGLTGTGKSLVSKYVVSRVQKLSQPDVNVGRAYINCAESVNERDTLVAIGQSLFASANPTDEDIKRLGFDRIPDIGLSRKLYYKRIYSLIEHFYDSVIIILDEADMLENDRVIMNLSRAKEGGNIDSPLGIIAISNDKDYPDKLNGRTDSSLSPRECFFDPYNASQLRDILRPRAEEAFQQGVLEDGVIELVAGRSASEHGDARLAVDLLRNAADIAHENGDEKIQEDHVRAAPVLAERDRYREFVENFPTQFKAALLALGILTENNKPDQDSGNKYAWFPTNDLHDQYKQVTVNAEPPIDTVGTRRLKEILRKQRMLRFINIRTINTGRESGRTNVIQIRDDPEDIVIPVICEEPRFQTAYDSITSGGVSGQQSIDPDVLYSLPDKGVEQEHDAESQQTELTD